METLRLRQILLLVFIGLLTVSCEEMLEVPPKSSISVISMWENPEDAMGALYGAYSQFRSAFGGNYHTWGDYRTGFYTDGNQAGSFHHGNHFNNNLVPDDNGTDWGSIYTLINDCNLIIKYVPDIDFTNQDDKNFIVGNAYFLRALSYFYIAKIWGDAPVVLLPYESSSQEGMFPERDHVDIVFSQAKMDVEEAINLIPEGYIKGKGIASTEVAYLLKTDIYLWDAKVYGNDVLDIANSSVDKVLNSSTYSLAENYEDVFTDDNNNELMLSIIYDSDETTKNEGFILPIGLIPAEIRNNPVTVQGGTNWYNITEEYRDFLHNNLNDTRVAVNAVEFTYVTNQGESNYYLWVDKYKGSLVSGTRIFDSDYRFYRFAEAILFKAEILNGNGQTVQAVDQLNKIAKRAYKVDNYYSSTLSQAEIDNIILDERIKEFSTEGKAWFDIIRFGKAFERITSLQGKESRQNILLWPVSYNTMNRNGNIIQTPGYE